MNFNGIKETCIYVKDLEACFDFYHNVLGLEVLNYTKGKHLFLKVGYSVLLFFNPNDSKSKVSPPPHFGGGSQHFAFEVDAEKYEYTKQEILAKGIEIIQTVVWPSGSESFYFNDPSKNVLEVVPRNGIWN